MSDRCTNCDREKCAREAAEAAWWSDCHCGDLADDCAHTNASREAESDCKAHTVNWLARAKKAESIITAATERATALSRAGLGTTEPWAQAGQVLREIAGQMLECLRGEDVPPVVLNPADDWVPVTERLPEVSIDVLAACKPPLKPYWIGSIRDDGIWVGGGAANITRCVTHWRPLPAPPVVSKTERSEDA